MVSDIGPRREVSRRIYIELPHRWKLVSELFRADRMGYQHLRSSSDSMPGEMVVV